MNTFSKKSLHVALAGLGVLSLAGTADAVMVNPNGLGQVLIYPYYTVRSVSTPTAGTFNTLMSIVNTTASTKAVKVRFREGAASKEVLDFNVFLSPHDVWTAAVTPNGTDGATIATVDQSCTIPTLLGNPQNFRTFDSDADVIGTSRAGRVTEGYFEVFEMATYLDSDPVAVGSTHANGVPADCSAVTDAAAAVNPLAPTGGLSGEASLINVNAGELFSEDATALTQFWDQSVATGNYSTTGNDTPNFTNAFPVASAVDSLGRIVTGGFASGELASTAALQRQAVINEFSLTDATLSGTDWVVTMPTKHDLVTETAVLPPFQNVLTKTGACDDITLTLFDREEFTTQAAGADFSPSPPAGAGTSLCWEANVLSFVRPSTSTVLGSNLFGSANRIDVDAKGKAAGWADLTFRAGAVNVATGGVVGYDPQTGLTFTPSTTFSGLPVIGFAAQSFVNGTLTDTTGALIRSTYGGSWGHRYIGPQFGILP
jgi:hypothetical protein